MPLIKAGPCGLQAQGIRGSTWQWSLFFLPCSCFSLDSLSYVVLAPAEHLMKVIPSPLPGARYPKPEPQFPIPTHHGGCAANIVSAGKCWSTMILVVNHLHFIFWASIVFPSKVLKPPLSPPLHHLLCRPIPTLPMTEFPSVWKLVLLHGSLLEAKVPVSNYLPLYCLISFALPHALKVSFHFWKSVVFCQHSEIVL